VDDRQVRGFFAAYEAAANTLDADALEPFFADACLGAAPGAVACTPDRAALRAAVDGLVNFYRSVDRGPVHAVGVRAQPLGAYHALATVQWTASFPGVAAPIPFEVSYLLQREDNPQVPGGIRIVAFVSHEDEAAMLREHGIMPSQ
jgi:hypothetical protein